MTGLLPAGGRVLSTFVPELLAACLAFMLPLTKRRRFGLRAVLGVLAGTGLGFFLPYGILRYTLEFVIAVAFVWACCDVSIWDALYSAVCAYSAQHLAFCLRVMVMGLFQIPIALYYPLCVLACALVYLLAYFLIARHLTDDGHYGVGLRQSLASMAVVLFFTLLLSHYVTQNVFGTAGSPYVYACLLYAMLCCSFVLWVQVNQRRQSKLAVQVEVERRLRRQQREQYELSRETIDIINRKCHDLKHQVAALRAVHSEEAREASLREIEESVMLYDSAIKTGNPVLDTVLTEKSLLCEKLGITWICMADGRCLEFVDPVDLYTIFGNALDNAIESVRSISDRDRRVIGVSVYVRDELALLEIENYYDHPLTFSEGVPLSTKTEGDHGYGVKSIRTTVEKHGGSVSIQAEDGVFRLCALLPLP